MPHSDFDKRLDFDVAARRLTISGPLDDMEDETREAVVFGVVTQHVDSATVDDAVTIGGEVKLFRQQQGTPDEQKTWWLTVSDGPHTPDLSKTLQLLPRHERYAIANRRTRDDRIVASRGKWFFHQIVSDEDAARLRTGPAFASAVLVSFKNDGGIETYSWSMWVRIRCVHAPRKRTRPAAASAPA